ncbi:MAG: type II secretion system F family protein [Gammaproteobacteria bacterium]|nr:type II secretion system F family protein [Gammaproteobacteria bacterium]
MAEFQYQAYTRQGRRVTGTEMADTREDMEQALKSRGLLPKSIARKKSFELKLTGGNKAGTTDFLVFTGELISLLESGMGILEAVSILCGDGEETEIGHDLNQVRKMIQAGTAFSDACGYFPQTFDTLFIAALKTGEQSGEMVRPLQAYYAHLERRIELKRKVVQALTYPIFLVITFTVILILMFVFVVPNFTGLYDDLSAEMPALTVWLLNAVENLPFVLAISVILLLAAVLGIKRVHAHPGGRVRLDRFKSHIPLFGSSYLLLTYWQFIQSLASLLRGGGNLVQAVRIARDVTGNHDFADKVDKVVHRISQGESLSAALGHETTIPARSLRMIAVGEESSNLVTMLESVSTYFDRQLDDRVKRLTSLIEPIIMLAIGLVVGVVIVALYLPVFGMINVIG